MAMLWCIEDYCWLTGQRFQATYTRLGQHLGFDWQNKPNVAQMLEAGCILALERERFLERLAAFETQRKNAKPRGARTPSRNTVDTLYSSTFFATPSVGPEKDGNA